MFKTRLLGQILENSRRHRFDTMLMKLFQRSNFVIFILSQPEPLWVRGTKVLLYDLGHMTKTAVTPIYGNIFFYYRNTGLLVDCNGTRD